MINPRLPTPPDPAAIDLDKIKKHKRPMHTSFEPYGLPAADIDTLIAAVEALQARVAELENGIASLTAIAAHEFVREPFTIEG